jgi:hypothetical protein
MDLRPAMNEPVDAREGLADVGRGVTFARNDLGSLEEIQRIERRVCMKGAFFRLG